MMRRPAVTDEMIEHALEIAADELSIDFDTLQNAYAYPTDGFELALELHSSHGIDIKRDDLDVLDAIDVNVERQHKALCKKWFEENNIQPPFPDGTEIEQGVIDGVSKYHVATYKVKEHGCDVAGRHLLIKFEDAKLPEQVGGAA